VNFKGLNHPTTNTPRNPAKPVHAKKAGGVLVFLGDGKITAPLNSASTPPDIATIMAKNLLMDLVIVASVC
jgi:hypothetical protein